MTRSFCIFLIMLFTAGLYASVPAAPRPYTITQPDGFSFEAVNKGNIYVSWTETKEGYTIVEEDGVWYYAVLEDNQLRAGRVEVGSLDDTERASMAKHLRPSYDGPYLDYGPINASRLNRGPTTQSVLVVLVEFADISLEYTEASFQDLMFGNGSTVKDFFLENSYDSFTITPAAESSGTANDGMITISLGVAHPNQEDNFETSQSLAASVVTAIDGFVNFASFDTNFNGTVSAEELSIVMILAGYETAAGNTAPNVWGHKSNFETTTLDGVDLSPYTMFGERHETDQATIGIMCHELGHLMFGLPDLYDISNASEGIGNWGLMGGGSWNATSPESQQGNSPAHFCAWSKTKVSFVTPQDIETPTNGVTVTPAASSASVKRVWADKYRINEYFLIANRDNSGYDVGLPSSGVLIWHIDESKTTNADKNHKLVDLEAADGQTHLDDKTNAGDAGDPYPGSSSNTTFNDTSAPNSKQYNGNATNIAVSNIEASGGSNHLMDIVPRTDLGNHIRYDQTITNLRGFGDRTAWSALRLTNNTTATLFDGFEVYVHNPTGATIDFHLYESLTNNTPTNLLHTQMGFAASTGWNRFLLNTPQSFPVGQDRVMVLTITNTLSADDFVLLPLLFDGTVNLGRSSVSVNGAGQYQALSGELNQHALLGINENCSYSLDPTSEEATATGGSDIVAVTADEGCAWTAVSNDAFITITGDASGTGSGSFTYTIAANNTINARTGTVTVANQTFTVNQAGLPCSYSLDPTEASANGDGDTGSVTVNTLDGCAWSAVANDAWITITSGSSGSGSGTVAYSVGANPTGNSRTGTMTIAGETFTINQDGATCTYNLSPSTVSISVNGGSGSIDIDTLEGCSWSASTGTPWILITSATSGTGDDTLTFSVGPFAGIRQGTITISGTSVTVRQAPCTPSQAFYDALPDWPTSQDVLTLLPLIGCD